MAHYRDLVVWQKSIDLVEVIYTLTQDFPPTEVFGLTSQMRRAAISIPSNIAEGSRRKGKEVSQFLSYAFGSASELETQLTICVRLKFGDTEKVHRANDLLEEILRMLNKMIYK